MEIWKTIIGFEKYEASNFGNIRRNGKILKQGRCRKGYPRVHLSINGKSKTIRTHILIVNAFLNHISNNTMSLVVDHIDNDRLNNHIDNLQIISNRENTSKNKKNKTSKYTGVYWRKDKNKWHSQIILGKVKKHLGYYNNEEDARKEYLRVLNNYNNANTSNHCLIKNI